VYIKGKIIDTESNEPIPYAHIINPRSHGGTTSNADGMFTLQIFTEDTLIIKAVGYVEQRFWIEEFPPKNLYEIAMKPVRYLLNEVTVTDSLNLRKQLGLPEAKSLDIPIELRGASYNEKPKWFSALVNPIAFLHYHTSKDEKRKRESLSIIKQDKQWEMFARYNNLETIKRLTGLTGNEADNFLIYINIHNRLPYYASQMEVEFQIMDLFFKYKKENQKK
jgi:hypothetical protein